MVFGKVIISARYPKFPASLSTLRATREVWVPATIRASANPSRKSAAAPLGGRSGYVGVSVSIFAGESRRFPILAEARGIRPRAGFRFSGK